MIPKIELDHGAGLHESLCLFSTRDNGHKCERVSVAYNHVYVWMKSYKASCSLHTAQRIPGLAAMSLAEYDIPGTRHTIRCSVPAEFQPTRCSKELLEQIIRHF